MHEYRYSTLAGKGIEFKIAEARSEVRDILRMEDVEHLFGHIGRRDSVKDIVSGIGL